GEAQRERRGRAVVSGSYRRRSSREEPVDEVEDVEDVDRAVAVHVALADRHGAAREEEVDEVEDVEDAHDAVAVDVPARDALDRADVAGGAERPREAALVHD